MGLGGQGGNAGPQGSGLCNCKGDDALPGEGPSSHLALISCGRRRDTHAVEGKTFLTLLNGKEDFIQDYCDRC